MVFSACYYDNQEEMYPSLNPENFVVGTISFNSAVLPIMTQHCNQSTCHNSIDRASQIVLDNHADLLVSANDGSLLGSIRHTSPYSPMPKSAGKLDDCTIQKVATWIEQGALDN